MQKEHFHLGIYSVESVAVYIYLPRSRNRNVLSASTYRNVPVANMQHPGDLDFFTVQRKPFEENLLLLPCTD